MSVDKIGQKDVQKDPTASAEIDRPSVKFEGTFFATTRTAKRQYYTIHPEWLSENITPNNSPQKDCLITRSYRPMTLPGRRCRSAPPNCRSRNPITWEYW